MVTYLFSYCNKLQRDISGGERKREASGWPLSTAHLKKPPTPTIHAFLSLGVTHYPNCILVQKFFYSFTIPSLPSFACRVYTKLAKRVSAPIQLAYRDRILCGGILEFDKDWIIWIDRREE